MSPRLRQGQPSATLVVLLYEKGIYCGTFTIRLWDLTAYEAKAGSKKGRGVPAGTIILSEVEG